MVKLTENESKIVDFLIRNFASKTSIRQIGKSTNISAMGAQKILKKFESKNIVLPERIGTGIYYKLNLKNKLAQKLAELVLSQSKLNSYAAIYAEDLQELRPYAKACALYGSILENGEKAYDVDVIVIIDNKNFEVVEKTCSRLSRRKPKKIHLMYQTEKDFAQNIREEDPPLLAALKECAVLWGEQFIIKGIKNGTS